MDYVEFFTDALGSVWALWLFGLVASYRLIAPAQGFVSERGLAWITARLNSRRFTGLTRRFSVGFKRYVDLVFGARQRRLGRCRIWMLRFGACALVSLLTFLALFWAMIAMLDQATLDAGLERDLREMATRFPQFAVEDIVSTPEAGAIMLWGGLAVSSLMFGLINTLIDYASFLETRNVLARMGRRLWVDLTMIVVDFVLTASIAATGIALVYGVTTLAGSAFTGNDIGFLASLLGGYVLTGDALSTAWAVLWGDEIGVGRAELPAQAMVLSAFATSLWIWVFFSGTMLLRSVIVLKPVMDAVVFMVDIEAHPFRAIWLMFALAWSAALAVIALLA